MPQGRSRTLLSLTRAGLAALLLQAAVTVQAQEPAADPYLESLSGRRELSPADWNTIKAGGEAFLVDLELAQLDATISYWISDRRSVYLIASGVRYEGGFLDSTIESFHLRTGTGDFQRDNSRRDDVNVLVNLKRAKAEYYAAPVRD